MPDPVQTLLELALQEDIGRGDITSEALFADQDKEREAVIIAKEDLIAAGLDIARKTFLTVDPHTTFEPLFAEGAVVKRGQVMVKLTGRLLPLLKAERVALNFMQHLSGIATHTRKFVEKVKKYQVEILDTRKTTPGLRALEKKAVRMGGASNHRLGLYDRYLIKENHLRCCDSLEVALKKVKHKNTQGTPVEVEVENLAQIPAAVSGGADIILLDNFLPKEAKKATKLIRKLSQDKTVLVEVSGGITLDNVVKYASAGVDRISVGALTHSSRAVDISMQVAS